MNKNRCPKCGSFTATFTADWTVAHRPDGTQCQSRFTWDSCVCGYQSKPVTATLDYWKQEAKEGRAILAQIADA